LTPANVTQEDAIWFSRLPDKVKRGYFSIEEEILLTPRKEDMKSDSADDKFYKLGETFANRSLPSLQSLYTGPSSPSTFDTHSAVLTDDECDMDDDLMDTFRWMDTDLDLSLDDYHIHLAETSDAKLKTPKHSMSIRKPKSFNGNLEAEPRSSNASRNIARKSLENWGSGWAPTDAPPVPQLPASNMKNPDAPFAVKSAKQSRAPAPVLAERWGSGWAPTPAKSLTSPQEPASPVDQGATHYLNPEARLKLRLYLASPSKFDEAVEFGFPSLQSPPSADSNSSHRPSTAVSTRQKSEPKHSPTFLDDSTTASSTVLPSGLDAKLDLDSSRSQSVAQNTVSSLETGTVASTDSFQPSSIYTLQSHKSEIQAQLRQLERDPYLQAGSGREMTLRMTLTRPDLRADESLLYPTQPRTHAPKKSMSVRGRPSTASYRDDDPMRLQELQVGDDAMTVRASKERGLGLRRFLGRK
jgi:hypothetical protein